MAYRDELEAARARIVMLETEVARLEREKRRAFAPAMSSLATLSALLFVLATGLALGLSHEWWCVEAARHDAETWRRLEGETAVQLHETQVRLVAAERRAVR
jgi:hypothetical protein